MSILSCSHIDIAKQNKTIQENELFSPEILNLGTMFTRKTIIFNHRRNNFFFLGLLLAHVAKDQVSF